MPAENALPSFWLSNSIEAIDSAHVRRFDLVIEIPNPRFASAAELAGTLVSECRMKSAGQQRTIGFQQWTN